MSQIAKLTNKVNAKNLVNQELREGAQALFDAIRPFVGKKIVKVDGSFTKEFLAAMPKIGAYWLSSRYSLARVFKVCASNDAGCAYAEATLYIGDVEGATLANVKYADSLSPADFRSDYSVEKVIAAREAVRVARSAMQAAENALCGFGEHDNG